MSDSIHPSNILHSGEVQDFCQAMDLYSRQMHHENHLFLKKSNEWGVEPIDEDRKLASDLEQCARDAQEAKGIFLKHLKQIEPAIAAELRARGGVFENFADALESGDYSNLAI
jgi:hypothetical protein